MRDDAEYAHCYRLRDERGRVFLDHGGIWLLELGKFATDLVETEQQRWLKFFTEAERLDDAALPEWMQTAEMRQAMSTLKEFSEKERAYHAYQARQNYLREQRSIQRYLDSLRTEAEQQRAEIERQRAEADQQRAEADQQCRGRAAEKARDTPRPISSVPRPSGKEQRPSKNTPRLNRSATPKRPPWRRLSVCGGCWRVSKARIEGRFGHPVLRALTSPKARLVSKSPASGLLPQRSG